MLVFTNGCFDLLTFAHVRFLRQCRRLGLRLVVGLNSDESVRRLKGPTRPIVPQFERQEVLEAIRWVDDVIIFDEDTPCELIRRIKPDICCKGPGYSEDNMPEAEIAKAYGGRVVILDGPDVSTTQIVERIRSCVDPRKDVEMMIEQFDMKFRSGAWPPTDIQACPKCGGDSIPIVYGSPSSRNPNDAMDYVAGGCVHEDSPSRCCKRCQTRFGRFLGEKLIIPHKEGECPYCKEVLNGKLFCGRCGSKFEQDEESPIFRYRFVGRDHNISSGFDC